MIGDYIVQYYISIIKRVQHTTFRKREIRIVDQYFIFIVVFCALSSIRLYKLLGSPFLLTNSCF